MPLFLSTAVVALAAALTSPTVIAANQKNTERWFEVEVILFTQLGDKSLIKETFSNDSHQQKSLPKYKKVADLLHTYLYPNIAALKLQLPYCEQLTNGTSTHQQTFVENNSLATPIFTLKSLLEITEQVADLSTDAITNDIENYNIEKPNNRTIENNSFDTAFNNASTVERSEAEIALTAQLVTQAEQAFNAFQFIDTDTFNYQELCLLPSATFDEIKKNNPDFKINGYSINNLKGTVDGDDFIPGNKPYLISKEALQLSDIVQELKLSKDFKPLLHLGWREIPKDRKYATAHKIYAGDNFNHHYQQAIKTYEKNKAQQLAALTLTTNALNTEALNTTVSSEAKHQEADTLSTEAMQLAQIQNYINQLTEQVQQISVENEQTLINDVNTNTLPDNLLFSSSTLNTSEPMPLPPIQPWLLNGFFKVHLNHYLYITADFNIVNKTLAEQTQSTLSSNDEIKTIRFEQNRRVISGEVHYFDHPYMGMIVQIRRYSPPEPDVDEIEIDEEIPVINSQPNR